MVMGRPKIELNWKQVDSMLAYQCTLEEVAAFLDVSQDTVERRTKEEKGITFAEYSKVKRQIGLISLRRTGFEMAKKHPAVWIFHAKNKLGMTDQLEVSGNGGQPIQFIVSRSSDKKKPEPEPDGV